MENQSLQQPVKRPRGMTLFLVLSFINACLWIIGSILMYIGTPVLADMMETGQMEEFVSTMNAGMDETMMDAMMTTLEAYAAIKPVYYIFTLLLYIGSMVGVLRMFKLDRTGLNIYGISQMLLLIAAAVYVYPAQAQSSIFSDFLMTAMFILLYYSCFKRIELTEQMQDYGGGNRDGQSPSDWGDHSDSNP